MNKELIENNIKKIIDYNNEILWSLKKLYLWIDNNDSNRWILDEFLDFVWLEKNKTTRLGAYFRIVDLQENSLELYMEEKWFWIDQKNQILNDSYEYVSKFHYDIQLEILEYIKNNNLLTDFYIEIFSWVLRVWKSFNNFFVPWRDHIINWVNKDLEEKFDNSWEEIIDYLNKNNLFDKWHFWEIADRSYSALVKTNNWEYLSKSYFDVFKYEITQIIKSINDFISELKKYEDNIYFAKQEYLNYLEALKAAFSERDVDNLVHKWSLVDDAWMQIKTPFQIWHPLEFYEDKYRKAVAPEWDLRILNTVFDSKVESDIENMYESIFCEVWIDKYKKSYEFSKANFKRVQLYLTTPVLYFWAEITGLFSAQVVPNDEVISDKLWKKIFAFPEMVLSNKKAKPFMKLQSVIYDDKLLNDYREYLFWNSSNFYKVYDIETIGHEYGHTLWLDIDSESIMNKKTWVFKNIEEFKATTWGLVAYFMWNNNDFFLSEHIIRDHVIRSIWLLSYKKVNEIEPYYCESLIHLSILFESGIIYQKDSKIYFDFNEETYSALKDSYIFNYKKLINIYLNKIDAWEFLKDYSIRENWFFMPKNKEIYDFVDFYYKNYKKIWNETDDSISKNKYIK